MKRTGGEKNKATKASLEPTFVLPGIGVYARSSSYAPVPEVGELITAAGLLRSAAAGIGIRTGIRIGVGIT